MEKLYLVLLLNAVVSWAEDDNTPLVLAVCIWCHYVYLKGCCCSKYDVRFFGC